MKAKVYVTLKKGVHDPQGEAVQETLRHLGFDQVGPVRMGKYIEMNVDGISKEEVGQQVESMCQKLLSNPVIESYSYEIE